MRQKDIFLSGEGNVEYTAPPTLSLVARCREVWHSATHHRLMEASNDRAFPYLTGVLGCLGDNDP